MAQVTTGVRAVLSSPGVYNLMQVLMGMRRGRAYFSETHIRAKSGSRVLDIGCGTAEILPYMPNVDYVGFDISPDYIKAAKAKYGSKGTFHCRLLSESEVDSLPKFDIVLAIGLLHHLDDDAARNFMAMAGRALAPGGRLITLDGCYSENQNPIARFLISRDRGQNVRTPDGYSALARGAFSDIKPTLKHTAWIPYTHWIMECSTPTLDR